MIRPRLHRAKICNCREDDVMRTISRVLASLGVASVLLIGAASSVQAADEWFVLSEQALNATNPSVEIKSSGGRWDKDVKQVKFSAEGGDVEVSKAVLHWDNRPDDTITNAGVLKAGGETAPKNAPGRKGRLTGVTLTYKVVSGTPTVKVWGYD
jgi:hypothetical protein